VKYHIVSALLILAAAAFYMACFNNTANGTGLGAVLCAAGMLCELSFWVWGFRQKNLPVEVLRA
jgi:hypothetical protein